MGLLNVVDRDHKDAAWHYLQMLLGVFFEEQGIVWRVLRLV